jgi:hypothetical protein
MIGLLYVPVTACARDRWVLRVAARAAETIDAFRRKRRRVIMAGQVYLRGCAGVKAFFDCGGRGKEAGKILEGVACERWVAVA